MSVLSVQSPYPIFTDTDGDPLESGYIWIGVANLDPQVNPLAVYWDAALTMPAVQPIRTLAGYPSQAGSPGRLYTTADHSIRVQNKRGTTVFTAGNVRDRFSADLIGYVGPDGLQYSVQDLSDSSNVLKGDALIAVKSPLAGGVARTQHDKNLEWVTVKDFGAVGNGIADDTQAFILALATGKSVFCPTGQYLLTSPITLSFVGQRLSGENAHSTYLYGGLDHDLVRVAASHCEVDHLHFRPSGFSNASPPAFASLRIYAALAHIHDNRFLSPSSGGGTAILCDDVNPLTLAIVAGAYSHTIINNRIGAGGYDFQYGIFSININNGQQATKILSNQFLGDICIYITKGGGNYYVGNLLQSATGTIAVKVGNGIDLQVDVAGETIIGNYFERFTYGIISRRLLDNYIVVNIFGNHWDNNANNYFSAGSKNFIFLNDETSILKTNGWQENYNSSDDFKFFDYDGTEIYNINRVGNSFEPRVLAHNNQQSLSFNANGVTVIPTSTFAGITGAGAARTGCFLGNGVRNGQHLIIRAITWSVEILNNPGGVKNIYFVGDAASATFGQTGNVGVMHLIWDSSYNKWFEVSRVIA